MRRLKTLWLETFRKDIRGAAVVEAALILPFFITLVFGAVDGSNYLVQSHRMEQGLSLGASYLSKSPDPTSGTEAARALAATGTVDGTGEARVPGWAASDITVTQRTVAGDYRSGGSARIMRLESTHTYEGFGMLKAITRGKLEVRAIHEERISS